MKEEEWQKRRRPLYEKTLIFMTLPLRMKRAKKPRKSELSPKIWN